MRPAPSVSLPWDAHPHHRHGHLQGDQGGQGVVEAFQCDLPHHCYDHINYDPVGQ